MLETEGGSGQRRADRTPGSLCGGRELRWDFKQRQQHEKCRMNPHAARFDKRRKITCRADKYKWEVDGKRSFTHLQAATVMKELPERADHNAGVKSHTYNAGVASNFEKGVMGRQAEMFSVVARQGRNIGS